MFFLLLSLSFYLAGLPLLPKGPQDPTLTIQKPDMHRTYFVFTLTGADMPLLNGQPIAWVIYSSSIGHKGVTH
jgi:hypothetical protein